MTIDERLYRVERTNRILCCVIASIVGGAGLVAAVPRTDRFDTLEADALTVKTLYVVSDVTIGDRDTSPIIRLMAMPKGTKGAKGGNGTPIASAAIGIYDGDAAPFIVSATPIGTAVALMNGERPSLSFVSAPAGEITLYDSEGKAVQSLPNRP